MATLPAAEPLASPTDLGHHADRLAAAIAADHPDGVTVVGILKGSVPFLADLVRRIAVPTRIELVAVAPYDGTEGRTRVVKDLDRSVAGEDVVLVSSIVDTGFTADFLLRHLREARPRRVRVCALADKRARRLLPVPVDYVALDAPDEFLLGYGLDYRGRYRNLAGLWTGRAEALTADADCYVDQLYGRAAQGRR